MDAFAALVLAAALSCPAPRTQALVGLWESTSTSKGGIGHVFEFRRDGSFVEATSVLVTMHLQPDQVEQTLEALRDGETSGNVREGVKYRHSTGAMAFERLTDKGDLLFRLPMRSARGCYTLAGAALSLDPFRGRRVSMALQWKGPVVELTSAGRVSSYARSAFGPWYDIEHIDYVAPRTPAN